MSGMLTPMRNMHNVVRDAAQKMQEESGMFITSVTMTWRDGRVVNVTTQVGATSIFYDEESEDDQAT